MRPDTRQSLIWIAVVLLILWAMTLIPVRAQPMPAASAASTPALTRADVTPTACGEGGIGEIYSGDRAGQIERRAGKHGQRVNASGFWEAGCTPPAAVAPRAPAPCIPVEYGKPRTWTAGGYTCTTAPARPGYSGVDDPRLDQVLIHGAYGVWRQTEGGMRGLLVEQCDDGRRAQRVATCQPATHCDTQITVDRDGVSYTYDGRPAGAGVPAGGRVDAVAADGRRWPVACVDGDWRPALALAPPVPALPAAASRPPLSGCGPQTVVLNGRISGYGGPRVEAGTGVVVWFGMRAVGLVCTSSGKLAPPSASPAGAASAADAWRRAMPR
jgi:hypothetical protein